MKIVETPIVGAFVIELERAADERGYFARTFDRELFAAHGLATEVTQGSVSFNHKRQTLRGMHYQALPFGEIKLVRCIAGAVYDVIVDMRPESRSYRKWFGLSLAAETLTAVYIPEEVAHGFLTLTDSATVLYQMVGDYHPAAARGVRWNDPAIGIDWPAVPLVINERDATYPLLSEQAHG